MELGSLPEAVGFLRVEKGTAVWGEAQDVSPLHEAGRAAWRAPESRDTQILDPLPTKPSYVVAGCYNPWALFAAYTYHFFPVCGMSSWLDLYFICKGKPRKRAKEREGERERDWKRAEAEVEQETRFVGRS